MWKYLVSWCFLVLFLGLTLSFEGQVDLYPLYETDAVLNWNGSDDPAIWLHPSVPDSSFFIGSDKSAGGGLELYNFDGTRFWTTPGSYKYNNVDVLYNFPVNGDTIDLVVASNNSQNRLEVFKVLPDSRQLANITGNTDCGFDKLYGLCLYSDLCYDKFYAFLTRRTTDGKCYQYELTGNNNGTVDASLVRLINNLPSRTEGMVADVVLGDFYIAEESVGVWKYGSRPEDGLDRVLMDSTIGPNLTALVEGLTIYYASDSVGYLIASSQGASDYQVYTREGSNIFLGSFAIVDNPYNGVDGNFHGDGVDVISYPFTSAYPNGVFIGQDTSNDVGASNYKIIPWDSIANALSLDIVTTVDPRLIAWNLCDTTTTPVDTTTQDTTGIFIHGPHHLGRLTFYPNPAHEVLNITFPTGNTTQQICQIFDSSGSLVMRAKAEDQRIDIASLPRGVYLLRCGVLNGVFIKEE